MKDGKKKKMKYARTVDGKITLKFMNKKTKGTIIVDPNKIEKIPKNIANTKKRQKNKRNRVVRKKRGIKTKSSTLELPNSNDEVENLLDRMKI